MAITLVGEVANVCDNVTGFNQGNTTVDDPDVDGGGAVGLKNSGAVQIVQTTSLGAAAPYDFSASGSEFGDHIIMWMAILNIPTATTGLQIYIGDSTPTASFGTWNVLPLDAPYLGGYALVIIDPARDFDSATTWTTTGNPAQLTNIDEVGARFDVLGTIMGNFNNCLLDQMTIGTGVRADGTGPNSFEDVRFTDEGTNQWGWWTSTKGVFVGKGKLYIGPVSGSVTSEFTDSDFVVSFAEERVATGFYEITMRGAGTDVTWDRGTIFAANATQARWSLTVESDTNTFDVTDCNFLGADIITLDDSATITGGSMVDCSDLQLSGGTLDGVSIINADTADAVAFITTNTLANISNCNFTFSDGHAIDITAAGTYTFTNNTLTGYGLDETNDAAIVNSSGGLVTINYTGTGPTVLNLTTGTSVTNNAVTTLVHVSDNAGGDLENARVNLEAADATGDLPFETTVTIVSTGTTATCTHATHGLVTGDKVAIRDANEVTYNGVFSITVTTASAYTYVMNSDPVDTATGTITSTGVVVNGLTDVSGDISAARTFTLDQPLRGFVRKSTDSPRFKSFSLAGNTVDATDGVTINVRMVLDE